MRIKDLIADQELQVREIDEHTVSKYAAAMRTGAMFPRITVDKDNRIICGNHRYYAYLRTFGEDYEVDVEVINFITTKEAIRAAVRDNASHGLPLSTWDMKRVALRLQQEGDSAESISKLLNVPVDRIKNWGGVFVVQIGSNKKEYRPTKHGLEHLCGKEVTKEAYEQHEKRDLGTPIRNMAAMITRHIQNGWIDLSDEKTVKNLLELKKAIGGMKL